MSTRLTNGIYTFTNGEDDWGTLMNANLQELDNLVGDHGDTVSFSQTLTSGVKIGKITINGTEIELYHTDYSGKADATSVYTKTEVDDFLEEKADALDLTTHTDNDDIHVTTLEKESWTNKQDALTSQQLSNIADVTNKANDSDVVHKSGNETISDLKTFGRIGEEGGQIDLEKSTSSLLTSNISIDSLDESLRFFAKDSNGIYATFFINFQNRLIYCDRECTLGTTSSKFRDVNAKAINGINPGALSLTTRQTAIYISPSYTVGDTITMPATGFLRVINDNDTYQLSLNNDTIYSSNRSRMLIIPVVKGGVLKVDNCSGTSRVYMQLYPSLGNVGE